MRLPVKTLIFILLGCLVLSAPLIGAFGQSGETYVIRNARIVPVTGPVIERGSVVIADGKIAAVGTNVSAPGGAKTIDGTGLSLYPGMIDAGSILGLTEISSVTGTVDTSEIGDNNADIHVDVAIHPDSTHIRVSRVNGITTVLTEPRGGAIAGQSALINLAGWVPKEMVLKSPVAMHLNWPGAGGGRGGEFGFRQRRPGAEVRREQERSIEQIKSALRNAKAYGDAKEARTKDISLPRLPVDLKLEALGPVARGEMPAIIQVNDERDIKAAIAFADEMKIKVVVAGGLEAYKVAELLKAKNIPVIVGPVLRVPANEDDPYDMAFSNAGLLSKAGVKIAFQTLDSAHVRDLTNNVGMAAAFGLPKEEALKAVTIYPAEILGVADKIGSIEKGKIANLILTDGDPLEALTQVKHLFINGREIPLTSKHTELYERYKGRP